MYVSSIYPISIQYLSSIQSCQYPIHHPSNPSIHPSIPPSLPPSPLPLPVPVPPPFPSPLSSHPIRTGVQHSLNSYVPKSSEHALERDLLVSLGSKRLPPKVLHPIPLLFIFAAKTLSTAQHAKPIVTGKSPIHITIYLYRNLPIRSACLSDLDSPPFLLGRLIQNQQPIESGLAGFPSHRYRQLLRPGRRVILSRYLFVVILDADQ